MTEKNCTKCGKLKPFFDFSKKKTENLVYMLTVKNVKKVPMLSIEKLALHSL